ncbi:hypothetical protein PCNPT3_06230 [Psychromonas sp. CNPT3]|uniref:hypothetical protein n=1 Tax=Psychromonas sp. CNPT3 TaxID=314282 RepID=UPI00006E9CF6|nr:hypothetical protein [Psychromonas sp. CNPT3]AGH81186.1 hypothetical protein PCNPT3_06230 [Psychromonas sp. CNPT3]
MKKFILLVAIIGLSGCQQAESNKVYDIKEVSNKTYLINHETGELSLVLKGKVLQLANYELPKTKLLEIDGNFLEKIQFDVSTKQIEDRVYYILNIEGYESKKKDSNGKLITEVSDFQWFKPALEKNKYDRIKIQFVDADGFNLKEHRIRLNNKYTNIVNHNDQVTGLRYEGSFNVNPLVLAKTKSLSYTYLINSLKSAPK